MVHKSVDKNSSINFKENVDIEEAINEAGHGRYNIFLLISCCILNIGSTIDLLGSNLIIPAARCDLQLTLFESGLLMSVSLAGFLTALPWGYVADTKGRKPAMIVSGAVGFIVSAMSSFSTNFYMMMVLKFIASSFSTASMTLTVVFVGENTCAKYRTRFLFILNVANFSSDFICFVMAFLILPLDFRFSVPILITYKPWRLLTLLFSVPMAVGTLLVFFFHESPKFHASKGDVDIAIANLNQVYNINNGLRNVYPVKSLMKMEIKDNKSFWDSVLKQVVPIFQPPLLWRTFQLFLLLTICVSTSNVFYTWLPTMMNSFFTSANEDINFCQKIIGNITLIQYDDICIENGSLNTIYSGMILTLILIVFNIAAIAFANWRRSLIIGALLISAVCCTVVDMVHHTLSSIVVFFMIQTVGITYGSVQSYFVDIYPTKYRVLATSLGTMFARYVCLAGVSLVGAMIVDNCRLTFYCWAIYIFCGILLTIFLPGNETTRGKSVKDTSLRA